MNKQDKDKWGQGWDCLFENIWPNLNQIRKDNLKGVHNYQNIDFCFNYLYAIMSKEVISRVEKSDWSVKDKNEVSTKANSIISLFKEANSYPEKVIAINMAEQFLRSIYEKGD